MTMIPIFLMGKRYSVPEGLTILKAIEYAGYRLVRGCGCRSGFCGACATVYRIAGEPPLRAALACQTLVTPDMHLTQLPFFPAPRPYYRMEEISNPARAVLDVYPEVLRCLGCGACSRACPQQLQVKEYVAASSRGELERAAGLSFECLNCGLCAARCPAGIVPYYVAILARRLYGVFMLSRDNNVQEMVQRIKAGYYDGEVGALMSADIATLQTWYEERDFERV